MAHKKDPAALFYIDKYIVDVSEMDADCTGWYTKLILHQYDKKSLPNDVEKLAAMCNVKFSEFNRFQHVFEHVLQHLFQQNDQGRLEQSEAAQIIKARETFKEKKSKGGILSTFIRIAKDKLNANDEQVNFVKEQLKKQDYENIEPTERQHVLQQMLQLYINGIENVNKDKDVNGKESMREKPKNISQVVLPFQTQNFKNQWQQWKNYKKSEFNFSYKSEQSEQAALTSLANLSTNQEEVAIAIIHQSMSNGWKGFFELDKKSSNEKSTSNNGSMYSQDFKRKIYEKLQSP